MRGRVLGPGNDIDSECEPIDEPTWSAPYAIGLAVLGCTAFWGLVVHHFGWLPVLVAALVVAAVVLTKK